MATRLPMTLHHLRFWIRRPRSAMQQTSSFQVTRWSLVHGAGAEDPEVRRAALERLCASYWYPLFAYLRRCGRGPDIAADLVQGLFAKLIETNALGRIAEGKGKFRSWLLSSLQNHERDQRDRDCAQKRGGGRPPIPIDVDRAERRYVLEARRSDSPEALFDRTWACEVLHQATLLLEQEMRSDGRAATFAALAPSLDPHAEAPDRAALAAQLGVTTVAARVALHRFRGRYRQILVRVVADSLGGTEEVGEELRALAQALATG